MGPIRIANGMKITGMFSNYADERFMMARPSIILSFTAQASQQYYHLHPTIELGLIF